jgi:Right handed beta helix region
MGTSTTIIGAGLAQPLRPVPPFNVGVAPTTGQVPTWDGSAYTPATPSAGGGGGSGPDLPEYNLANQTAAVASAGMVGKLVRYDTTAGAVNQTLPAATVGAILAVNWALGANTLTLTAAGSDVIGSGAVTFTVVPTLGETIVLHCTTAGRWRGLSTSHLTSTLDARYVNVVGGNVWNVALPTGTASVDTPAIQSALDAANTAGGGLVRLAPGTYAIQAGASAALGGVRVFDRTVLAGRGMGVTTLRIANGNASDLTGVVRTPSGVVNTLVTIRDLTIDGNKANKSGTPITIGFYCGVTPLSTSTDTDISCERVEIMNCTDYGFDPHERTTRLRMVFCVAHHNDGDGMTLDGCYDSLISGCISYSNGRHGFNGVTASQRVQMSGCEAYSNASNGLTLQNGSKGWAIVGCRFHGNTGAGVVMNGVAQSAPQLDQVVGTGHSIAGCLLSGNGTHGLQLVGCAGVAISGNVFRDNSQTTTNASDHLSLDESGTTYSIGCSITGNDFGQTAGVTNVAKYAIEEKTSNDGPNIVIGNVISTACWSTAAMLLRNGTSALAAAHNGQAGDGHPATVAYASDSPVKHGLLEWNFDPTGISTASQVLTSGTLHLIKITAQASATINNIITAVNTVGATLTAGQNFAALFDSAGNRIGITADQSTAWTTTGLKTMALTAGVAVTAGQDYYIVLLSVGTTPPSFPRSASSTVAANAGLATTALRFAANATGQTSMPSTITLSSNTGGSPAATFWCALS